jgi:probable F420-dependent oxidoreductase
MRYGLVTPVLTMLPRAHASWEASGTLDDVATITVAAEQFGYEFVTCSEHVAIPEPIAASRGGRYWDPLAVFGYLAARTSSIRFATYVLVLGYHHPLEIVKRYGTLDLVSDGRLVLGVGVGSLAEEFALLDASFDDRGARADDALRAIRASWGISSPTYVGAQYAFDDVVVDPVAPRRDVPIWVGGRTARSLRRGIELGTGWAPFGLSTAEIATMLEAAARPDAFEVVLQPQHPFDPIDEPDRTAEQVTKMAAAGATALALRFVHHSRAHYVEQLQAMQSLAV